MTCFLNDVRHCMALQKRILVQDGQGGFIEKWETIGKTWTHLIPLSSVPGKNPATLRGQRRGSQKEASKLYQGIARSSPLIKKGMRLREKERILVVLDEGECKDGYQSFTLSPLLKSDGGADE